MIKGSHFLSFLPEKFCTQQRSHSMIFILNSNPTSLSFQDSWSFNIVSELSLAGGSGFEPPLSNLNPHLFI